MKLERLVLLMAALAIFAAFFLPYMSLNTPMGTAEVSGISMVQSGLEMADVMEKPGGDTLLEFIGDYWAKAADFKDLGALIAILLTCLGPVFFGLYALGYLYRALAGKSYKRGIFFTLLFTAFSWAVFYFVGKNYGIELSFFSMAGPGYWVGAGGMLAAALSLFFSKDV